MLQRVTLAHALLHEPELLFLDEPTSTLDPVNFRHIYKGIERLKVNGTTISLTTHDMQEAEELCNRVAFLHQGSIQLLDAPNILRRKYATGSMRVELNNSQTHEVTQTDEGADCLYKQMRAKNIASIHSNEPTLVLIAACAFIMGHSPANLLVIALALIVSTFFYIWIRTIFGLMTKTVMEASLIKSRGGLP